MNPSDSMEEYLQFIQAFADTMAGTFKQFAHICRDHLKKSSSSKNQFTEMRAQLIEERKKRMDLQDKMKQILNGSQQTEPSNPEERRKPKNAFALFVADQRDKMFGSSPSLNFTKITSLAAIKWKKMSEQQRKIYQKKFEEMMKLYEEKQKIEKNKKFMADTEQNNERDGALIKREDIQPDRLRDIEEEKDDEINNEEREEGQVQEVGATQEIPIEEENQPTLPIEPVETRPLENILNLFHTPVVSQPQQHSEMVPETFQEKQRKASESNPSQEKPEEKDSKLVQSVEQAQSQVPKQTSLEPQHQSPVVQRKPTEKLVIDPSIQIIQQIVIDPTIQESQN